MISSTDREGFSGINAMAGFMWETSKIANSTAEDRFYFPTATYWREFGKMGTVCN
jgi:hypothetical protein